MRALLITFLGFFLLVILSGMTTYKADHSGKNNNPLLIAHRGASALAPENTIAAFDRAIELKADFIEIDVQMTKDGELVIIHDVTVDRTTNGKGKVKDFTYEEIALLDAGSWYSERFAGERIPKLSTIIENYQGKIGILIELKKPSLYPGMTEQLANMLNIPQIVEIKNHPIIVQSFNHQEIKKFHTLLPTIPKGIIISDTSRISKKKIQELNEYISFVCINKNSVNKNFLKFAKQMNWQVFTWTVSTNEMDKYTKRFNVDGIVTNHPNKHSQLKFIASR